MSKLIATINMTLDGYCDHTVMTGDDEVHEHFTELLRGAGTLLYGRVTYQLMENYWPSIAKTPTGNKPTDDFALAIENISKVVYSRTLKKVDWKNTELKKEINKEELSALKQKASKDILAGSPSLIVALTQLGLVDEYQLCVHPVIAGAGLPLFNPINSMIALKLLKTKNFRAGQIMLYYEPLKK